MLEAYLNHLAERTEDGLPPLALNAEQTAGLIELLKNPSAGEEAVLLDLITNRVPPDVDEATYVKAGFLSAIAKGEASSPLIDKQRAVELLGTMQGGYNIATLVELLDSAELSPAPRPDIPLYALAMLKMARDGIVPEQQGAIGPLKQIAEIKAKCFPVAYVGDVVGTGSSRESAAD